MTFKLILIFLCLVFLFTGCQARHYAKEQKSLTDKQETADRFCWDFGRARQGEILQHAFILKNDTAKILNIKNVSTSCGCTASEVKNKTLSPGESTSVEVKFNTEGYSGTVQQYVYVDTDNLDNSLIRFIIKADVVK